MLYASDFAFKIPTYNRKLARLKCGPLLKEILRRFNDKSKHKLNPKRSLWIYSAHDTTVASLLDTLNVFKIHSPPYAATVLLEMRIDNNVPLISLFYKTSNKDPDPIEIPDCGIQCPLSKMYELYSDVIPEDWEAECDFNNNFASLLFFNDQNRSFTFKALTIVVFMVLIACLIYSIIVYHRRSNYFRVIAY